MGRQKIWYAEHGFIEGQNLIATYEYANAGFNSQEIDELIEKYFGWLHVLDIL